MHSPLPDSSALEAGIIEDQRPSRLSTVQDNVRHLLRNSILSSTRGSILISPPPRAPKSRLRDPFADDHSISPTEQHQHGRLPLPVLPVSPLNNHSPNVEALSYPDGQLFPPLRFDKPRQIAAQLSGTTLNHPDLRPKSLTEFIQQKARNRTRNKSRKYVECRSYSHGRRHSNRSCFSHWLLCIITTLVLCAVVTTYITIYATQPNLPETFHVLFILGIVFALILFLHSILRMCLFNRGHDKSARFYIVSAPKRRRRHCHDPERRRHDIERQDESVDANPHFSPSKLIAEENLSNEISTEVRPDPHDAHPMAGVQIPPQGWDQDVRAVTNPPPAYGKWRGSVRADPELLHWQILSSVGLHTPTRLSPAYEAAASTPASSPPTYVTRQTPRGEHVGPDNPHSSPSAQPEMVQASRTAGTTV